MKLQAKRVLSFVFQTKPDTQVITRSQAKVLKWVTGDEMMRSCQ